MSVWRYYLNRFFGERFVVIPYDAFIQENIRLGWGANDEEFLKIGDLFTQTDAEMVMFKLEHGDEFLIKVVE